MKYLILGATSDVSVAFAKQCPKGSSLVLCARNSSRLDSTIKHLKLAQEMEASVLEFDLLHTNDFSPIFAEAESADVVLIAWGILESSNSDKGKAALEIIDSNFRNQIPIIENIAGIFEKKGTGIIAAMTSVAGLRGRASNYLYGSAKAGMIAYLSGLRNRLSPSGAHVLTIIPGFMDTKMTANLDLPSPLTASPNTAAKIIHSAINKKKNVVYVTSIWWLIMTLIRNIPESIFKKMKL